MSIGTALLSNAGVSIWLDDLSRNRLDSGSLSELIREHHVVGVTTNPAIFAKAITTDTSYDAAISEAKATRLSAAETITKLTTEDVQRACDLLHDTFERTNGVDGRVSIEVEPALAHDTEGTIARARELWELVDRPNAMIKIPATDAGLPALSEVIGEGISVNVTLIFSLTRYRQVINATLSGYEQARAQGIDLTTIHSVASFFVSRIDSAVDPHFDAGPEAARSCIGTVAIANAAAAYEVWQEQYSSERARFLLSLGAPAQRLLWASTGVKDSRFSPTLYVTELVAPQTVNTMPEATLEACSELTSIDPQTLSTYAAQAATTLIQLQSVDLDYHEVTQELEHEGLQKFTDSWNELVSSVEQRLGSSE